MWNWIDAIIGHPILLLGVGGAAGANARYWVGKLVVHVQQARFPGSVFPWGTLLINVSGSVILGLVAAAYLGHADPVRRNWYLLLGTGFCGGFTTFSTFSLETLELLRDGRPATAAAYVFGSVLAGLLGVWLAVRLSGR
jgi:CrcB protein